MKNLYLFYDNIWWEFGQRVERKELKGAILAGDEQTAKWGAKLAGIAYDKIEVVREYQNNSWIFKVEE